MLQLRSISIFQFKNYTSAQFPIDKTIVGITGKNGMGKTNLLDALFYACFTHSYFSKTDQNNVKTTFQGFRIQCDFDLDGQPLSVQAILRENGKKEFVLNDIPYAKFSGHIGKIPAVMVCPDDVSLITEGSDIRRKYLDTLISQIDPSYLAHLIEYNKVLQQRNGYLKQAQESRHIDSALLDIYDTQLILHGEPIFTIRNQYFDLIAPLAATLYEEIAGKKEAISFTYDSLLQHDSFVNLLQQNRQKDCLTARTQAGIHRDDLLILLDNQPFKSRASQGQRKSLLFALKLAEFELLKSFKGYPPLLLLDDVFEKLDEQRMHNLLQKVCTQQKGQVFITDTHPERIRFHFEQIGVPFQLIDLEMNFPLPK